MQIKRTYQFFFALLLLLSAHGVQAQGAIRDIGNRFRGGGGSGNNDSLQRRNKFEDSITIHARYLDSTRNYSLDSSINDFYRRFPVPTTYNYLGNTGTAAHSILFAPIIRTGFDPGFHALDLYKWTVDKIQFFNTTRPYTELAYLLGSKTQQIIQVHHTQNFKPYWNIGLHYRLINSPGYLKNQRSNHNNYLFTSWYQSPNKRYNNYVALIGNKLQVAENGGIRNDRDYMNDPVFEERISIPTKFGPQNEGYTRTPFDKSLITGNDYREFVGLLRQQYDFGRKDSIVTDSTVIPLFYPRIRFEHTFQYRRNRYTFQDYQPDSAFYHDYYNLDRKLGDTVYLQDRWRELDNDFSIYTFPDAKNLQQFLKLGAELQLLNGKVKDGNKENFVNTVLHGEYRNRTRNQKWDMSAFGRLHVSGYNQGDYHAFISLQRLLSSKLGSLQVGFENSNRSPAFIQKGQSSFNLNPTPSLNKENTSHIFASISNPKLKLSLGGDYFLMGNYLYYKNFYTVEQESALFNVLRLSAFKTFKLARHVNWYLEAYLQQKTGNVDVNVPLFLTRNRIAFEGNFFKNLFMSTGIDVRYHTPFDADHYSPVIGQFVFQDSINIKNRPDIHAYFNFRIRGFQAYIRAENLNAFKFSNGITFTKENFSAPDYPYPGLVLRLGIFWSFVN